MAHYKSIQLWNIVKGTKTEGPYTTKQIQELFDRSEITPTDRLQPYSTGSDSSHFKSDSKLELKENLKNSEDSAITVMDLIKSLSDDPADRLFETLQFARIQAEKDRADGTISFYPIPESPSQSLFTLLIGFALLILLVLFTWLKTDHNLVEPNSESPSESRAHSDQPPPRPQGLGTPSSSAPNSAFSSRMPSPIRPSLLPSLPPRELEKILPPPETIPQSDSPPIQIDPDEEPLSEEAPSEPPASN